MFLSLPEVWDLCLEKIYDKQAYVAGFIQLLQSCGINKNSLILDAGCGFGFPAIDLLQGGFTVIGVDKSSEMVRQIRLDAEKRKVQIEAHHLMWNGLGNDFGQRFNFVYCRGNSLVYAASWEQNWIKPSRSEEEIRNAIQNFYQVLKPGGYLYVDITRKNERPHKQSLGKIETEEGPVEMIWEIKHDQVNKVRSWIVSLRFLNLGKTKRYHSYSYCLPHEDLVRYFCEADFREIKEYISVVGETNYDVFLAKK